VEELRGSSLSRFLRGSPLFSGSMTPNASAVGRMPLSCCARWIARFSSERVRVLAQKNVRLLTIQSTPVVRLKEPFNMRVKHYGSPINLAHLELSHQSLQNAQEFPSGPMRDWLAIQTELQYIKQLVKRWRVDNRPRKDVNISAVKSGHKVLSPFGFDDGLELGLEPDLTLSD